MSDMKPVVIRIDPAILLSSKGGGESTVTFYPAAAYEAKCNEVEQLQKENAELKRIQSTDAIDFWNLTEQNAAQEKRIAEQQEDNLKQKDLILNFQDQYAKDHAEIESLRKQVETLSSHLNAVVEEMNHLMNDSHGVAGLHLNGDIAPWASLLRGGEFYTWLSYLSDAAEYVQSKNGE